LVVHKKINVVSIFEIMTGWATARQGLNNKNLRPHDFQTRTVKLQTSSFAPRNVAERRRKASSRFCIIATLIDSLYLSMMGDPTVVGHGATWRVRKDAAWCHEEFRRSRAGVPHEQQEKALSRQNGPHSLRYHDSIHLFDGRRSDSGKSWSKMTSANMMQHDVTKKPIIAELERHARRTGDIANLESPKSTWNQDSLLHLLLDMAKCRIGKEGENPSHIAARHVPIMNFHHAASREIFDKHSWLGMTGI
jgi:hypothetical protein